MMTLTLGHEYLMTGMIWGKGYDLRLGRVDALYAWLTDRSRAPEPASPGTGRGTASLQRSSNRYCA